MSSTEKFDLNTDELDEEEQREQLQGDMIGSTVFSQSFVLKTLLQFQDLKWNEDLEENLCYLWSMSNDKEVCEFLFSLKFPSVIANVINSSREERLIELLIGILANMIVADCEETKKCIENDDLKMILNVHNCPDTSVLIQLMRLVEGIIYYIPKYIILLDENIINTMMMILNNCLNFSLILQTLKLFVNLTSDEKICFLQIDINDIYDNSLKAFETVIQKKHDNYVIDFEEEEKRNFILEFFNLVANLIANHENDSDKHFLNDGSPLNRIIYNTMKELSRAENVYPPIKEFNEIIGYIRVIFENVNKLDKHSYVVQPIGNHSSFYYLCLIFHRLSESDFSTLENLESVGDFLEFVFEHTETVLMANDMKMMNSTTKESVTKFFGNRLVKNSIETIKVESILSEMEI